MVLFIYDTKRYYGKLYYYHPVNLCRLIKSGMIRPSSNGALPNVKSRVSDAATWGLLGNASTILPERPSEIINPRELRCKKGGANGYWFDFCSRIVHIHRMILDLQPGQRLARGVARHLHSHGFVSVEEFIPARGLRVDVMGLGPKGEIWVVECKSSRADFQSDGKWQGYLEWCDRYFWAVDMEFPTDLLPEGTGLIIADAYDAEIIRMAPEDKLAPARRKVMIQKFATQAARRLQAYRDPGVAALTRESLETGNSDDD